MMRCVSCGRRFEGREETIITLSDSTRRRFCPSCFIEDDPDGTAWWSGGPPYEDIVRLDEDDFKKVVSEKRDAFDLGRLHELEETHHERPDLLDWLEEQLDARADVLDQVQQEPE